MYAHCKWCHTPAARKHMFHLREGPLDHYTCSRAHAELWLGFRYRPASYLLLRMTPGERLRLLGDTTIEETISKLLPPCDRSP